MSRRAAFVLITVSAVLGVPASAQAGGSWLEVTEGETVRIQAWELAYAAVGTRVTMRSEFSDGQQAHVSEGPWYAYLTRESNGRTDRILLGSVRIDPTGGYPYVATVTFNVPDVPTGSYWVNVCDLGCERGVGDLGGGVIALGPTAAEARLFATQHILRQIHRYDARTISSLRDRERELRSAVEAAERVAGTARSELAAAEERVELEAAATERLEAQLAGANEGIDRWRLATVILGVVVLIISGTFVRARHRPRFVVPDTPADLVDEIDREPASVQRLG
jgi:hypothetical protein